MQAARLEELESQAVVWAWDDPMVPWLIVDGSVEVLAVRIPGPSRFDTCDAVFTLVVDIAADNLSLTVD